ncbi:MAG: (2Fe-2S)-binding protein [Anaerolineales bacterium]|nr:(2Fe-2S)-binding protein [Anaerolineales bacterium]
MSERQGQVWMELTVNGRREARSARAGQRLIDFLREDLRLTGAKEGCGEGECGSCTVLLDGLTVLACLTPMERANGRDVVTIEGLGTPAQLHPLQKAMIEEAGVQCGMCTPGVIMSGVYLLQRNPQPTRQDIVEGIIGNLCRCTGYQKIIRAIERAAQEAPEGAKPS